MAEGSTGGFVHSKYLVVKTGDALFLEVLHGDLVPIGAEAGKTDGIQHQSPLFSVGRVLHLIVGPGYILSLCVVLEELVSQSLARNTLRFFRSLDGRLLEQVLGSKSVHFRTAADVFADEER